MRRLINYPNVVSTFALLVALSGGAYAAGLVGTSDLKDGAVTTPKLHRKSVTLSRVAPDVKQRITAAADAVAPHSLFFSDSTIQQVGPTPLDVATMVVPGPGTYLVAGSIRAFGRASNPGHNLFCNLSAGTSQGANLVNNYVETQQVQNIPLIGTVTTFSPGDAVTLTCHQGAGSGEITVTYDLTLVRVVG